MRKLSSNGVLSVSLQWTIGNSPLKLVTRKQLAVFHMSGWQLGMGSNPSSLSRTLRTCSRFQKERKAGTCIKRLPLPHLSWRVYVTLSPPLICPSRILMLTKWWIPHRDPWFSDISVHQNDPERLWKQIAGPQPTISYSVDPARGAGIDICITLPDEVIMTLIKGTHEENQSPTLKNSHLEKKIWKRYISL